MSSLPPAVWWAFLTAGLALAVIVFALGAALLIYQRRIVALHRRHAAGLLRAQEAERSWVARELHDDVLQRLAMVLHELEGNGTNLERMRAACRSELEDLALVVRRVANHLHPAFVDREGLVPALRRLAAELADLSGVALHVDEQRAGSATPTPAPGQALVAYRIAQEALNNLIRHAGAPVGQVRVRARDESFEVEITDRGRGFDVEEGWKPGHLGLVSMAERARAAGGRLLVTSEPGAGTVVRLRLPYGEPA